MTNHADPPQPSDRQPDPTAPYRPDPTTPAGPSYRPGQAAIPEPHYPPTAAFPTQPMNAPPGMPPVNFAPPGQAPDYGSNAGNPAPGPPGYPPSGTPGYPPPGTPGYPPPGTPGYPPPTYGQPPTPPGYAPAAPSYGQPPGYGYDRPPLPPPRRSNVPLVAVIIAVTLLLCGGVATAGVMIFRNVKEKATEAVGPITGLPTQVPDLPNLPTDLPQLPDGSGHQITVTYEVTGDGPVDIVYTEKLGSAPAHLSGVKLPWKITVDMETPALLSVVALRVDSTSGSIGCRTLVDGAEVKQNQTDRGNFGTATCIHFALD